MTKSKANIKKIIEGKKIGYKAGTHWGVKYNDKGEVVGKPHFTWEQANQRNKNEIDKNNIMNDAKRDGLPKGFKRKRSRIHDMGY